MVVHMTMTYIPVKNEEVKVGDVVFITRKGVNIEGAVLKREGRRIKVLPEDRSGEIWVAPEECDKIVSGGAEELMSRAAREQEKKAREEAIRKAEEDRKAAEKAEKDNLDKLTKDRTDGITNVLNRRSVPARDWCPVGKYNWIESPVLMDQTKDVCRVVWYEIDIDKDYGGVHEPPKIDLSEVEELKEAVEEREQEKKEKAKEEAKKKKGKPKKPTDDEIKAQEAEKQAELDADAKAQQQATRRAEDVLKAALKKFHAAEGARTPVTPPKYPPDLPPAPPVPQHPKNQAQYEEMLKLGHAGDRVYFTDGSYYSAPFAIGSKDRVLRGDGLCREVVDNFTFSEKVVTFKAAYDGGMTLTKHDCFPYEDPGEWYYKDEEKWKGEFRVGEDGTEDW